MLKYARILDPETNICAVGTGDNDRHYQEVELMTLQDVEKADNGCWYIKGFAPITPEPLVPTYAEARAAAYPDVVDQLDSLYHDINSGKLGEDAKTSEFYLARKAVKDEFPKPISVDDAINTETSKS